MKDRVVGRPGRKRASYAGDPLQSHHDEFVDSRTADGHALEPEISPRTDGEVYVCGMADPQPLPDSPEGVEVSTPGQRWPN